MSINEVQTLLENLLDELSRRTRDLSDLHEDEAWKDEFDPDGLLEDCDVTTYERGGYMTRDAGMVLRHADGSEFQITIIQSRYAAADRE